MWASLRTAIVDLRNEAIACLALPDMRPGTRSVAILPGAAIGFDAAYQRYGLCDQKGAISVFRLGDDRPIARFAGLGGAPATLQLSADGRFVACFSALKPAFQVWAVDEGRPVFPEPLPFRPPSQFSRDSKLVVAVKPDGSTGIWDLRSGRETRSSPGFQRAVCDRDSPRRASVGSGLSRARSRRGDLGHRIREEADRVADGQRRLRLLSSPGIRKAISLRSASTAR